MTPALFAVRLIFWGTLHVGGKHEHAARLLVPTTVLSPFPPLSGWRICVAYATSISVIHPSLYGWRLFISTLSGWRWFISTLSGWRCFISTLSGWRWVISTLQGWRMFISTLLGWRICLAYATPGSSQGYTGISVYRRWHRPMSLTHQWIGVRLACMPRSSASPNKRQLPCPVSLKG